MKTTPTKKKFKEPVTIRKRELATGRTSLYLDIYQKGNRKTESLGLFLYPGTDPMTRRQNADTLKIAEQIKADRILALRQCGVDKFDKVKLLSISLADWMQRYADEKPQSGKTYHSGRTDANHAIQKYLDAIARPAIKLIDIDKNVCRGFLQFLKNMPNTNTKKGEERTISAGYAAKIQANFTAALNCAVREELIDRNPMKLLDSSERFHAEDSKREFLNLDELKLIIDTPLRFDLTKRAFLFCCFTGLRFSDVTKLTGKDILTNPDGNGKYIRTKMQKTQRWINLPLSAEALKWIPQRESLEDKLFPLVDHTHVSQHLDIWMKDAGIEKHVTFHCARHTFATLLITKGADIYTVSKLLGHTKITTTEIYAKLVDQRKVDAISKLDNLFE